MLRSILLSVLFTFTANLIITASAILSWNGSAGDSLWTTAANWTPAQVPAAGDQVSLNTSNYVIIPPSTMAAASKITIGTNSTLELRGSGATRPILSLTDCPDRAIFSNGTIINNGRILIGQVSMSPKIGIDMSGTNSSLMNKSEGEIFLIDSMDVGIRTLNNVVNEGVIIMGTAVGNSMLLDHSGAVFQNLDSIAIGNVGDTVLVINQGQFVNETDAILYIEGNQSIGISIKNDPSASYDNRGRTILEDELSVGIFDAGQLINTGFLKIVANGVGISLVGSTSSLINTGDIEIRIDLGSPPVKAGIYNIGATIQNDKNILIDVPGNIQEIFGILNAGTITNTSKIQILGREESGSIKTPQLKNALIGCSNIGVYSANGTIQNYDSLYIKSMECGISMSRPMSANHLLENTNLIIIEDTESGWVITGPNPTGGMNSMSPARNLKSMSEDSVIVRNSGNVRILKSTKQGLVIDLDNAEWHNQIGALLELNRNGAAVNEFAEGLYIGKMSLLKNDGQISINKYAQKMEVQLPAIFENNSQLLISNELTGQ